MSLTSLPIELQRRVSVESLGGGGHQWPVSSLGHEAKDTVLPRVYDHKYEDLSCTCCHRRSSGWMPLQRRNEEMVRRKYISVLPSLPG